MIHKVTFITDMTDVATQTSKRRSMYPSVGIQVNKLMGNPWFSGTRRPLPHPVVVQMVRDFIEEQLMPGSEMEFEGFRLARIFRDLAWEMEIKNKSRYVVCLYQTNHFIYYIPFIS